MELLAEGFQVIVFILDPLQFFNEHFLHTWSGKFLLAQFTF